jgi:6-phosphogluconolactonase
MDDAGGLPDPSPTETRPGVRVFRDATEIAWAAARQFEALSSEFIASRGTFSVALSGGRTPQALYRLLASDEFRSKIAWTGVHFFWGDERAVPPDHPESNYGMVRREMLERVPIPPGNVHRMEAERSDMDRAAQDYEDLLRRYLDLDAAGFPRFHLVLLGMGSDGHTASLFPDATEWLDTSRSIVTLLAGQLGTRRMTLTLPVLNAAHHVTFLVTGEEKARTLKAVLAGDADPPLAAQRIVVPAGRRLFLVDRAAAREILP